MNRMKKNYDVIVIGGGLAGIQAALSAKNCQTKVLLIAKGFGSFYYGSGAIDLLGATQKELVTKPWSNLDSLSGFHPYKILGENQVRQGLAEFYQLMEETGDPLIANDQGENFFLPTALGSIRPTYLAPLSLVQGDLRFGKKIKLFGVAGFHYFSPRLVARELTKAYQRLGMHSEISCGTVKMGNIRPGPVSAYDLALWLDYPDHVEEVIKQVLTQLEQEERIGFPAVLGLGNHRQVLAQIEKEIGKKVFEIPTIPPSVPGIRLHQHLFMMMRKMGIDCIIGYPAVGAEINGDRISSVRVSVPGKSITFSGGKYILAAGGLGSEGLVAGPGWIKEPLFNLPVYHHQEVGRWSTSKLWEEQPYACFGLRVDEKMRPLDAERHICYANLHAAGSILAHFDSVAERSTGGVDIATGFMAGKECGGEV